MSAETEAGESLGQRGIEGVERRPGWDSYDGIRRFPGPEPEKAVFYPEDERFLVRREELVSHYEVAVPPDPQGRIEPAAQPSFARFLIRHE